MVYSTRRFVLCLTLRHFVLVFLVLLALRLPRLGKRELILALLIRLFDLCLFGLNNILFQFVETFTFKYIDRIQWHNHTGFFESSPAIKLHFEWSMSNL